MAASDADARSAGFATPVGTNLISGGDDAIRQNARTALDLIRAAQFIKPFAGTGGDLDTYTTPGLHGYWADTAHNPLPGVSGNVIVMPPPTGSGDAITQYAFPYGNAGMIHKRFHGSGGYSTWQRLDAGAVDLSTVLTAPPQSAAQLRTFPLILTTGGSGTSGPTSGTYRMPVKYGATITRWRLHFRNNNPRFGADGPAATISAVYAGPASAGQFTAAPTQIATGLVTGSTDAVTPWQSTPLLAGTEYAIAYSFTASATNQVVGGGWSASSINSTSATLSRVVSLPLDVWIEAEVEATVPAVAVLGDSLASAVGGTLPVYDSVLSQWARANGALPVHYTASGDTMAGWSDPTAYKWQRWQHLSRPDAAIHALGNNDVFGGADLPTLKSRRKTTMRLLEHYASGVIYSLTITPRTGDTSGQEQVRRDYNTWLKRKPDTARDVFDVVPAISLDDEQISPGFDVDGTHLTTAGYTAMAGTITRPLTSAALPATVPRLEVLERDTGFRSVPHFGASGAIHISRTRNTVTIRLVDFVPPAGTYAVHVCTLPSGFRYAAKGSFIAFAPSAAAPPSLYGMYSGAQVSWARTLPDSPTRPSEPMYAEHIFTTADDWPSTLPGSPV